MVCSYLNSIGIDWLNLWDLYRYFLEIERVLRYIHWGSIWVRLSGPGTQYGLLSSSVSMIIKFQKSLLRFFVVDSIRNSLNLHFVLNSSYFGILFFNILILLFDLFNLFINFIFLVIISIIWNNRELLKRLWLLHSNFANSSINNFNDVWVENQLLLHIKHIVKAKVSNVGLVPSNLCHHV